MIPLRLDEVAAAVGGTATADPAMVVDAVSTDSRTCPPGALFVALRGDVHDGHDHVAAALTRGAGAVLVEHADAGEPAVVVADTWQALAALGGEVRDRVDPIVVAVTGSVGKTTTKDLAGAACATLGPTTAARGSYNNEAGVPLTLLACTAETRVLVSELGARGRGHIAELVRTVRPDIGVVTAVAGVHLELFGDLDDVEAAKGELVEGLPATGTAVLNLDDPRVARMAARTDADVLGVSLDPDADAAVRASSLVLDAQARPRLTARTPAGEVELRVPVAGRHQATNALLALAAAIAAGADAGAAAAAIGDATVSAWRGAVTTVDGRTVLDDAYNANPTSVLAALETLAALEVPGRRVGVLGVMAEIGADHEAEHERVGEAAAGVVDVLVVVGEGTAGLARGARRAGLAEVVTVADAAAAAAAARRLTEPGDALLVKASRVAGLEAVTERLRAGTDDPAGAERP